MSGKIQKKFYLSEDVANWLDNQKGNKSQIVEDTIRGSMGSIYRKKQLKKIIDNDEAGTLEAIQELEEIEKYKESTDYKLLFLQCQDRIIRECDSNKSNNGLIRSTVRDGIMNILDMDRQEVMQFINNTISDYEKGYINRLDIKIELEQIKDEKDDFSSSIEEDTEERKIIRHESGIRDYNPFS